MKIESLIRRPGGSRVTIDGAVYLFEPEQEGGPHVARVDDPAHVERLLSVPEGFRALNRAEYSPNHKAPAQELTPDLDAMTAGEVRALGMELGLTFGPRTKLENMRNAVRDAMAGG